MKRLIISHIPDDFDPDNDLLFGPFCLIGHEDSFTKWDSYKIIPDPIRTISELKNANEYTVKWSESILHLLKDKLNNFCCLNKSTDFYRVLLLPWLLRYVQVFWERYLKVQNLKTEYSDTELTIELVSKHVNWTFQNTLDYFFNGALNPHYNEWLLSRLIEINCPEKWQLQYIDKKPVKQQLPPQSFKMKIHDRFFMHLRCRMIAGMNFFESVLLSLLLSFRSGIDIGKEKPDDEYFDSRDIKNDFPGVLLRFVLAELPECFKELDLHENRKSSFLKKGKARIIDAYALNYNEKFKQYLAASITAGEKIITTQHGGTLSPLFASINAEVEYKYHARISWGYRRHSDYRCNFIDLPSPYISRVADTHVNENNNLVFVGTIVNVVSYELNTLFQPFYKISYIKKKISFMKKLENRIIRDLSYRPYPRDIGCINEERLLKTVFPAIEICKTKLHAKLLKCRLLVLDNPGTTLSIAMAANVPTICYWDREIFPFCRYAEPVVTAMRKAGILFDNESDAAEKVNKVWDNVKSWWTGGEVQAARQKFCRDYARTSRSWFLEWVRMIRSL